MSSTNMKDVWQYDPAADIWTQKTDFPGQSRAYALAFSIGSKAYFGLGAHYTSSWAPLADFWEYDGGSDTWIQRTSFGGGSRWFAAGFSLNNKIYIGTGSDANGTYPDFWEYDPSTDQWTQKANFPFYRFGCVGFSLNGKGYIGLGTYCGIAYQEIFQYDPVTDAWFQKANLPGVGRWRAFAFTIGQKAFVGAGRDIGSNRLDDFYEYNNQVDLWVQKASFGGGLREAASCFVINNKGYAGMGYHFQYKKDLWEYGPDSIMVSVIQSDDPFEILAFPNPTEGKISINPEFREGRLTLFNTAGTLILCSELTGLADVDLSDQPKGVYLLKIVLPCGTSYYSRMVLH